MSLTSDERATPENHSPKASDVPRISALEFKEFMQGFPSGVAVLATLDAAGQPTGMTCSALCSLSLAPPMLLACVGRWGRMRKAVENTGSFTVNLLDGSGLHLAQRFASSYDRPFADVPWRPSYHFQLPIPAEHVHRTAECNLHSAITVGDHTILIGEAAWIAERDLTAHATLLHGFSKFAVWRPGLTA
jgi:flavin reductase (DIM6/NTAB) family NADH-FMN oxidoreductase RutF